jgi:hypothetical protein
MPFSSVLGASSVIKPGVCTSSTRPTVPYTGQLIYETDTGMVAAWNGSAWVYTATSGLVLVKTQTIGSAVSSVTVSDAFSATYNNYRVMVDVNSASTGLNLGLTLGSTATGYYRFLVLGTYSASTVSGANNQNATSFGALAVTADGCAGEIEIHNPNVAQETGFLSRVVEFATGGGHYIVGGYLNDTTAYTAFTLTTSTGTITGGTVKVYGYKN